MVITSTYYIFIQISNLFLEFSYSYLFNFFMMHNIIKILQQFVLYRYQNELCAVQIIQYIREFHCFN